MPRRRNLCDRHVGSRRNRSDRLQSMVELRRRNVVKKAGTATSDQECEACATGTYSSAADQTSCVAIDDCAAGTELTTAGTPTSNAECAPCETGTYCAGGTIVKTPCDGDTWDDDAKASTACAAWSDCAPEPSSKPTARRSRIANARRVPSGKRARRRTPRRARTSRLYRVAPCATVGKTFERSCGNCGTQTATWCRQRRDRFRCCSEPANACAPGSIEAATACGYWNDRPHVQ